MGYQVMKKRKCKKSSTNKAHIRPRRVKGIATLVLLGLSIVFVLFRIGGPSSKLPENVKVTDNGVKVDMSISCLYCRATSVVGDLEIEMPGMATCPECGKRFHMGIAYKTFSEGKNEKP